MESVVNFIFYFVAAIFIIKGIIALIGLSVMAAVLLIAGIASSSKIAIFLGMLATFAAFVLIMIFISLIK